MPVDENISVEYESFEENGHVLEISDADLPNINLFATSTPNREDLDDPFVMGSHINARFESDLSSLNDSDDSSLGFGFRLLAGVRRRPRRIVYTDEESFTVGRPELPVNWKDRELVCVKYVDACLSKDFVFPGRNGSMQMERYTH